MNTPIDRETSKHREAFEAYLGMGPGRSLTRLAKKLKVSTQACCDWNAAFDWPTRVKEYEGGALPDTTPTAVIAAPGKLIPLSPEQEYVVGLINQCKLAIDGCFKPDRGKLVPKFAVRHATDFAKLIEAEKDLILIMRDLEGRKGKKTGKVAENINFNFGDLSAEEQLKLIRSFANPVTGRPERDPNEVEAGSPDTVPDKGTQD